MPRANRQFIPLTRVVVYRRGEDQAAAQQEFLLVNRDSIEVIRPLELPPPLLRSPAATRAPAGIGTPNGVPLERANALGDRPRASIDRGFPGGIYFSL